MPGCPLLQVPAAQVYLLLKNLSDGLRVSLVFKIKTPLSLLKSETG